MVRQNKREKTSQDKVNNEKRCVGRTSETVTGSFIRNTARKEGEEFKLEQKSQGWQTSGSYQGKKSSSQVSEKDNEG